MHASLQLLGRADNLKDFVRRGCQEAWIEITLSGGPGRSKIVVRREIKQQPRDDNSTGYTSKWRLDGGRIWVCRWHGKCFLRVV